MARVPAEVNRLNNQVLVQNYEAEWKRARCSRAAGGKRGEGPNARRGFLAAGAAAVAARGVRRERRRRCRQGGCSATRHERGHRLRDGGLPAPSGERRAQAS